ncbi:MAG: ABC transporter transmembrane domain-containing protein, partial [Patescibacteria group bacterium]
MVLKNSPVLRVVKLFADRKREVVFLLALVFIAAALDITVPFISQRLIDVLVDFFRTGAGSPLNTLILAAAGILLVTIVSQIVNSIYNYRLFITVTQTEDKIRNRAFEKYLRLHALFHHGSSSGQIIGRLDRGATAVWAIAYDIIGHNLIPPLMLFLGVFAALLFKNTWIALMVIIPFPIYLLA